MDLLNRHFRLKLIPVCIFVTGFSLYLFSSAPALAPYRDMGEMVTASHTLGIVHPPGYPVYTLIGKISTLIPFANVSYRVNLVSVIGGALSAVFLYLFLIRSGVSLFAAILGSLLWLTASGVWIVSIVTEMYSLNLAAAAFLFFLATFYQEDGLSLNSIYLTAFLGALFLGIRLELVLIGPGFLLFILYLFRKNHQKLNVKFSFLFLLFGVLGFSIYFYLMVRSSQKPWFNWNRPENFERLWGSIVRKTHGGTLDLLSENYAPGELFWTDMRVYLKDAVREFHYAGIFLALAGLYYLKSKNKGILILTFFAWLFTGPYFLYKANLPPNTHALSILEPHFLLPDICVAVWCAFGLEWLISFLSENVLCRGFLCVAFVSVAAAGWTSWNQVSKRDNFYGVDYANNILRSVPPNSILVMQKDVQLFSLWATRYAMGKRKDVTVVARGLSGSPWYIEMRKDEGAPVMLCPLKRDSDFALFIRQNPKPVFAGWDEDVPFTSQYRQIPYGLVREIAPSDDRAPVDFLREIYVYRGNYHYQLQKEFFSSDLIDDYSKGHFSLGIEFSKTPTGFETARKEWNHSIVLNSDSGAAYYRRGFTYFEEGKFELAARDFQWSEELYDKTMRLTKEFHSLPEVVQSVKTDWANSLLNLGVTDERLGKKDEAEKIYLKALEVLPMPNAHYNLAVLYWNKDWEKVVGHLQAALQLDPNNQQARSFLPKALYALEMTRKRQ